MCEAQEKKNKDVTLCICEQIHVPPKSRHSRKTPPHTHTPLERKRNIYVQSTYMYVCSICFTLTRCHAENT